MATLAPEEPQPGTTWIKSSLSFSNSNCVELARLPDGQIGMRNSRHPDGASLAFTPGEWATFLGAARAGEFDHLLHP